MANRGAIASLIVGLGLVGCATTGPAGNPCPGSDVEVQKIAGWAVPCGAVVQGTEPQATNDAEIRMLLLQSYPSDLRSKGISGTTAFWVQVGRKGQPIDLKLDESSGYDAFDQAARRIVPQMRFDPARDVDGEPVPVWVYRRITFNVR